MTRISLVALAIAAVLTGGPARADVLPGLLTTFIWTQDSSRPATLTQDACLSRAEQALSRLGFEVVERNEIARTGAQKSFRASIGCRMDRGVASVVMAWVGPENDADARRLRDTLVNYMSAAPF